jgi:hypothetical protein
VQVDDAEIAIKLLLVSHPLTESPEIGAEMEGT